MLMLSKRKLDQFLDWKYHIPYICDLVQSLTVLGNIFSRSLLSNKNSQSDLKSFFLPFDEKFQIGGILIFDLMSQWRLALKQANIFATATEPR